MLLIIIIMDQFLKVFLFFYFFPIQSQGEYLNDKMHKGLIKRNGIIIEEIEEGFELVEKNELSIKSSSPKIKNDPPKTLTAKAKEQDNERFHTVENLPINQNNIEDERSNMMLTNQESMDMMKSEVKTLDIGLDTLSLIDQLEMMNSLNSALFNKMGIYKFMQKLVLK